MQAGGSSADDRRQENNNFNPTIIEKNPCKYEELESIFWAFMGINMRDSVWSILTKIWWNNLKKLSIYSYKTWKIKNTTVHV